VHAAAETESDGDDHLLAVVDGLRGLALPDSARYEPSLEAFYRSITPARKADKQLHVAWALSMTARTHLLRGETATALDMVEESISIVAIRVPGVGRQTAQQLEAVRRGELTS